MRRISAKWLLLGVLIAAPALAAKPQIQWDQDYDFSAISTFQWQSTAGASLAQSEPFLHSHIMNSIEFELSGSGLTEVQSNPDVYVTYYGSTETELRVRSDSVSYGVGGYGRGSWGYYGYGRTVPVRTNTTVTEYERGTLVVDIWDAASNELIWRGSVSDIVISDSIEKNQKNIEKSIRAMAKQAAKLRARAE